MKPKNTFIGRAALLGALVLVACSSSDQPSSVAPSIPLGSASARLSTPATDGDGADSPTLAPKWAKEYVGTLDSGDLVSLAVTNSDKNSVSAVVEVRGYGLDGRSATRSIYTGSIAASSTKTFSLVISNLPVRSDGVGSAAEVRTTIHGGAHDGEVISSVPLHYTRTGTQYVFTGSFPQNGAPVINAKTFDAALRQLVPYTSMLHTPHGEVLGADGRYVDVTTLPPVGDTYHKLGQQRFLGLADAASLHALFTPYIPKVDGSLGALTVCSPWQSQFIDEGKGESVGGPTPASYAQAVLASTSDGTWVWSGPLDASGCTSNLPLADDTSYTLYVASALDTGDVKINIGTGTASTPGTNHVVSVEFSTLKVSRRLTKPVAINLALPVSSEIVTNAAAVMSKVLYTATGGFAPYAPVVVPKGSYQVEANARCQFSDTEASACAYDHTLYLGPNPDGTHNTQWKFVAAHEFGHLAAYAAGVVFPGMYTRDWGMNDPLELGSCGCGFVSDSTDRAHCLQSRQVLGAAETEAFAHLFAANVWNTLAPSQCTFVYYKNFRSDDGSIARPPVAKSCATPVKWLENHCVAPARGVEWDWLNFWRAAATDPNPTRMLDLFQILPNACGSGGCGGGAPSFVDMATSAEAYYGGGGTNANALSFRRLGNLNGVNH